MKTIILFVSILVFIPQAFAQRPALYGALGDLAEPFGLLDDRDWVEIGNAYAGNRPDVPLALYDVDGNGRANLGDWVRAGRLIVGLDNTWPAGEKQGVRVVLPSSEKQRVLIRGTFYNITAITKPGITYLLPVLINAKTGVQYAEGQSQWNRGGRLTAWVDEELPSGEYHFALYGAGNNEIYNAAARERALAGQPEPNVSVSLVGPFQIGSPFKVSTASSPNEATAGNEQLVAAFEIEEDLGVEALIGNLQVVGIYTAPVGEFPKQAIVNSWFSKAEVVINDTAAQLELSGGPSWMMDTTDPSVLLRISGGQGVSLTRNILPKPKIPLSPKGKISVRLYANIPAFNTTNARSLTVILTSTEFHSGGYEGMMTRHRYAGVSIK